MSHATLRERLDHILAKLKEEISILRTSRATPALVENILVDYYGTPTPVKALASISTSDARTLVIQPWDKQSLQAIEKAIQASSLGVNPIADRDIIRISLPSLTEERRREMLKVLGRHLEDARIQVRLAREEALKDIDRREKAKEISENQKFREREDVEKRAGEVNKKIEDMGKEKEREVLTV